MAMLLMKSPMRTMITVELPYSVSVTHTSVTRLHVTCYKLHVTRDKEWYSPAPQPRGFVRDDHVG